MKHISYPFVKKNIIFFLVVLFANPSFPVSLTANNNYNRMLLYKNLFPPVLFFPCFPGDFSGENSLET